MNNDKRPNIFNVRWTEVYKEVSSDSSPSHYSMGEITFKQNKRRSKMKSLLKGILFLLVASVSGAVSGALMVEKNYSDNKQTPGYYNPPDYTPVYIPKNSVTKVAEMVGPAVVGISNSTDSFANHAFSRFSGSGLIFNKNGYIITNYHVIEGAEKLFVKIASDNSKPMEAKVVSFDKVSDLAILKIEGENFPEARFGDSSRVRAGDVAIAIGNPFGQDFAGTLTSGIISATNRRIEIMDSVSKKKSIYKVLQTDAAINPGNSGGPLCNEAGEVIGIISLKAGSNLSSEGMGFAISINEVNDVITALMKQGRVPRPSLGITGGTAVPYGNNGAYGVYVREVYEGSGAALAGIKMFDIIVELHGTKITTYDEYSAVIEKCKIGDTITCKVWRNEKIHEFKVKLQEQN